MKWLVSLLLFLLANAGPWPAAGFAMPCPGVAMQGQVPFDFGSCDWTAAQTPEHSSIFLRGRTAGLFTALRIRGGGAAAAAAGADANSSASTMGYTLSMQRLTLYNVTLAPANASGPKLLPLGLFSTAPANVSMMDVRIMVVSADFQHYLTFFSGHLRAVRTKDDGGVGMHTDGSSFLNVPFWSDNSTELYSVTIISGPCRAVDSSNMSSAALAAQLQAPGCNVRAADNTSLVPTLLRDATVNTSVPLVIRILTNVTLGPNLQSPIVIRRPVLLLGTASSPVSVDFGMVVNQLDATAEYAQVAFQSIVLENLAPGDAESSIMAAPYSIMVSTNVWAILCNRSEDLCVPLTNVTLVVASTDEVSYITFMGTMYNSPSPSLRQLASFYITDLKVTDFKFAPGPTNNSIEILHWASNAWHFWYVVLTTQPVYAPKLATPARLFGQVSQNSGVLIQGIVNCSSFQSTQGFSPNRVHAWQLLSNVSIGGSQCPWPADGLNINGPTTLLGQVTPSAAAGSTGLPSMRSYPLSAAVPADEAAGSNGSWRAAAAGLNNSRQSGAVTPPSSLDGASSRSIHALGFHYQPHMFQLPVNAPDRYLQIRNITLRQLPQWPTAGDAWDSSSSSSSSGDDSGSSSGSSDRRQRSMGRRLLQSGDGQVSPSVRVVRPGMWTMLLWPFNRSLSGPPAILLEDAQLMLPAPEWEALAAAARSSRYFAVQLQGSPDLALSGVTLSHDGGSINVVHFQGPGISGAKVQLLPDPAAAAAMPGYVWPAGAAAAALPASSSSSGGLSTAAQAGVGVAVGFVGMLAAGLVASLLLARRRRRLQQQQQLLGQRPKQHHAPLGGFMPGDGGFAGNGSDGWVDPTDAAAVAAAAAGPLGGAAGGWAQRCAAVCVKGSAGSPAGEGPHAGAMMDRNMRDQENAPRSKRLLPGRQGSEATPDQATSSSKAASSQHQQQQQRQQRHSLSNDGSDRASEAPLLPAHSISEPLPALLLQGSSAGCQTTLSSLTAATDPVSHGNTSLGSGIRQLTGAELVEQSIAHGLQQWNNAVAQQTIKLMQQRMRASSKSLQHLLTPSATASSAGSNPAGGGAAGKLGLQGAAAAVAAAAAAGVAAAAGSHQAAGAGAADAASDLRLFNVIGQGSFGAVYLGAWRGKQVAVKVMHLPAHAFAAPWQSAQPEAEPQSNSAGSKRDSPMQQHQQQQRLEVDEKQQQLQDGEQRAGLRNQQQQHHQEVVQAGDHMPQDLCTRQQQRQQQGQERGQGLKDQEQQHTEHLLWLQQQQKLQQQRQREQQAQRQLQLQQNSRSHMAMMEAVLSTNLHHPNIIQVYTYSLTPLMAQPVSTNGSFTSSRFPKPHVPPEPGLDSSQEQEEQGLVGAWAMGQSGQQGEPEGREQEAAAGAVTGWQVQIVQEYADRGTLREALDRRLLPHLPDSSLLQPAVALSLSHDIVAAMLHLHSEGIVHGDLKAGNVLLQSTTSVCRPPASGGPHPQPDLMSVWMEAGVLPVTAKVADFGLALPLGPTDTHATMLARGTPTHMCPALITSGHVGKASDVYAFGIKLFEILTGLRPYAGVAVALLPHKVAVEGLRPSWPPGVPAGLRALAEACWTRRPEDRPTFKQILSSIEAFQAQLAEGAELQYTPPHLPNIPPDPNTAAAGGRAATMPAPTPAAGQLAAALPPLPHKRRVQVPLLLPEPPAAAGNAAQQQQGLAGVDVGQRAGTAAVAKGAHQGVVGSPTAGGATGPTAASAPAAAAGLGGMHTPATSSIGDSSPGPSRRTSLSWSEVSHGRLG